jgi:hypothetical protein
LRATARPPATATTRTGDGVKRGKPLNRRRKGPDALLTAKLDKTWALLVKARAGYICEVCGMAASVLHAHHIISRGHFCLRHEPRNGVALCVRDHFGLAHGDVVRQQIWREWLDGHRRDDLAYVLKHQHDDGKLSIPEKRDKLADLEAQLYYAQQREAA